MKVNTDAAILGENEVEVGAVFRDSMGEVLLVAMRRFQARSTPPPPGGSCCYQVCSPVGDQTWLRSNRVGGRCMEPFECYPHKVQ